MIALTMTLVAAASDVRYVDASVDVEGDLLGGELVDVDGDGRPELTVAVRVPTGGRELWLYRVEGTKVGPEAYQRIPVLEDVLAYGVADVREEEGRELLFLTRTGAWSYSTRLEGYRGNVRRLAETELLYDVPDPDALPYWPYVQPAGGGDLLILPDRSGIAVWAPLPEGGVYAPATRLGLATSSPPKAFAYAPGDDPHAGAEVAIGGGGVQVQMTGAGDEGPFLDFAEGEASSLVSSERSLRAPAWVDVDADEAADLVLLWSDELWVYLAGADGRPGSRTRTEEIPDYLDKTDHSYELHLADVDADGDPDLIAELQEESGEFENPTVSLLVLENDRKRLLPDAPAQVLRFEAAELRFDVADVNGDGRPDLLVRKFELPALLESVTGLEFTLTHLLYLGQARGRPFSRQPDMKHVETFDENNVQGAIRNRSLAMDCSGDGIADLVEVDLEGRVAVRRLTLESSFFGGESWSLDGSPWKRFETRGNIADLRVEDVNGDGLGDFLSRGDGALTIVLSSRGRTGGRR